MSKLTLDHLMCMKLVIIIIVIIIIIKKIK